MVRTKERIAYTDNYKQICGIETLHHPRLDVGVDVGDVALVPLKAGSSDGQELDFDVIVEALLVAANIALPSQLVSWSDISTALTDSMDVGSKCASLTHYM